MNVASLNLCRELWELSGWDKTQNVWAIATGEENKDVLPWLRIGIGSSGAWEELSAYDLGYLLRRLPAFINSKGGRGYKIKLTTNVTSDGGREATTGYEALKQVARDQTAGVKFLYHPKIKFQHGSLENATCQLAIELFKEGILKKEGV
jgi:hypothetical protein